MYSCSVDSRSRLSLFRLACAVIAAFSLTASLGAQTSTTGAITGRVLNPSTGEYVRNASIRVQGTNLSTETQDGGSYRLSGIPAGEVTLTVTYTGSRPVTATVRVSPGATATHDFELESTMDGRVASGQPIQLSAFRVSSERDGNAKAIMQQRSSMNITNSVASDVFGDVAEGNVGEFLKHMPGIMLNLVEGEARTVSLRGLGAEYTAVTLDGISLASADANSGAAGDARAFSFEQVSLNSMESIEVSKTISADVDANAPAGTINLKTKRAFDRQGRRIAWQANATAFGRELTLGRTPGPDDNLSRKIRGGGIFEYSDIFLDRRLGLVLNISESNVYSEITHTTMSYNETATDADPRPAVITQLSTFHGPRTNRRSTVTFTSDFKATENLVLSFNFIYNHSDLWFFFRNLSLNAGARAGIAGDDLLMNFTSGDDGRVSVNPIAVAKLGTTYTYTPRFEYKKGDLTVEGRFAHSDSESTYKPNDRGAFRNLGSPSAEGVRFTAERSALDRADWQVRQVAGPDISDGANYTSPTIETQDGRYNRVKLTSADLSATLATHNFGLPVVWKAGLKRIRDVRDFDITRDAFRYDYTGPGAGTGSWAAYRSPYDFDYGAVDASLTSSSGNRVFYPNLLGTFDLFRDHPEYFTQSLTATNYYNATIGNRKHYEEEIDAAFLMGTARAGKWTLRAGLRWEMTTGDSLEFNPLTADEVRSAGFPVDNGRATTIPGIEHQYLSRPLVSREGTYDHFFPSASLKYRLSDNLDFHFGYSSTIRRPTFRDIAGIWIVNDESARVSAPNPKLEPETSDNFSFRAAYYFEPVGILAVNFFQNNVQGLHRSDELTAAQFGNTDPLLDAYTFTTTTSSANEVVVRGFELEYSQSLSFLPGPFKGLNIRGSYTRNYADVIITRMAPHTIAAGLGYSYNRLNVWANANWHDDQPTNTSGTQYVRQRINVDAGGGFRVTDRISVFLSVRNIFDEPYRNMLHLRDGTRAVRKYEIFGTNFTLGVKGVF